MDLAQLKIKVNTLKASYNALNVQIAELDNTRNSLSVERSKMIPLLSQLEEAVRKYEAAINLAQDL